MFCRKEGGDLASVHNVEEYSFIISQLGYRPTDELWIGLNDLKIQLFFEWSDGTPVTYTKWLRGEPTHTTYRQEDCVVMKGKDGYWADQPCDTPLGYICKRKPLKEAPDVEEKIEEGCRSAPSEMKKEMRNGVSLVSSEKSAATRSRPHLEGA
ncbi:macrophage mannose receptor 1-like [Varanus komodoensis]|uniref:macrophage mannose receptor 1-like n=1 Tax=Varanus komodoensis TaxID=61221 RepID=UPI001CF7D5CF|nr:macrophage mannose receptor 1-like [Varanus komodoensis]